MSFDLVVTRLAFCIFMQFVAHIELRINYNKVNLENVQLQWFYYHNIRLLVDSRFAINMRSIESDYMNMWCVNTEHTRTNALWSASNRVSILAIYKAVNIHSLSYPYLINTCVCAGSVSFVHFFSIFTYYAVRCATLNITQNKYT